METAKNAITNNYAEFPNPSYWKIDGRKEQFNIMQYLCNFSCSYGVVQKAWESIQSHEENASQVISSYLTNACIIAWVW
jgi:hypothetical protein